MSGLKTESTAMHSHDDELEYQVDTLSIRTGHNRSFEGEHAEPIYLTSSLFIKMQLKRHQNFQVKCRAIFILVLPIQRWPCLKSV